MAQAGYTPIQLYFSTTAAAVPLAANLAQGELAINIADGKLYYENSSGVVTLLASSTTVTNSFSAGTTGFTPSTATTGAVTLGGTLITSNGGTGLSSYTAGDLSYYASGTALTKLAIGTAGQFLTSTGTAPQWSTLSGVAVTTFSAGTTGFTPNTATSGAITLAGTLATTNGGTGLTSFTSGGVVYASSTSALATGSALTWNGSTFGVTGAISVNTGAANLNALGLLSGSSGNRIGLSLGRTAQEAYIGIASTSNSIINGDVAGDLDILTTTGNIRFSTNAGASLQATLDTSGNLGLGVTPSAFTSTIKALQIGPTSVFRSGDTAYTQATNVGSNVRQASAVNYYIADGFATDYTQQGGAHIWSTVASGSAGASFTFTQAMVLGASGNLGIGNTNPSSFDAFANNLVVGSGSGSEGITIYGGSTDSSNLSFADGTGAASYQGFIQYSHATDSLNFYVNYSGSPSARMIVDSSGRLLIGGTSTYDFNGQANLVVNGTSNLATITVASTTSGYIAFADGTTGTDRYAGNIEYSHTNNRMTFGTNGIFSRVCIDSSGNLLVGTTTLRTTGFTTNNSQYAMETTGYGGAQWFTNRTDNEGTYIVLGKSRGTTVNSDTVVVNGDTLGAVIWQGTTGSGVASAAQVRAKVDGSTISSSSMPGRLEFYTTPSGSTTMTERMRISSAGTVNIATGNSFSESMLIVRNNATSINQTYFYGYNTSTYTGYTSNYQVQAEFYQSGANGTTLTIPITNQGSVWVNWEVRVRGVGSNYNNTGNQVFSVICSASTATFALGFTATSTGNVASVAMSGTSIVITFTSSYYQLDAGSQTGGVCVEIEFITRALGTAPIIWSSIAMN